MPEYQPTTLRNTLENKTQSSKIYENGKFRVYTCTMRLLLRNNTRIRKCITRLYSHTFRSSFISTLFPALPFHSARINFLRKNFFSFFFYISFFLCLSWSNLIVNDNMAKGYSLATDLRLLINNPNYSDIIILC